MVKVAVLASGSGSNFENLVLATKDGRASKFQIELLIVDKGSAFALERAKKLGVEALHIDPKGYVDKNAFESKIIEILEKKDIQLLALAGYMRIVGEKLLNRYRGRLINIHPAYLPEFPGKDGIGDAFKAGVKETGVTIHFVDEGIDTGEIIYQERVKIDEGMELEALKERIHAVEHRIYPMVLENLSEKN